LGIIFLIISGKTGYDSDGSSYTLDITAILSGLIFLFIIALELKDKLHAKTELEEGHAIQKALMPDIQPEVSGWDIWLYTKPANDVGGDLLDILNLPGNRYGVSIGDVAGKGLSAALLMAKLQATIRALAPDFKSLSKLGKKINEIFYRDSLPKLFSSLIYIEIESGTSILKMFNAGHPPPLLIRGNSITKLEKGAPALGILANPDFNEKSFEFTHNDILVAYSDGVTEARNEIGGFFGEDGLNKELSNIHDLNSKQIGEKLITAVDNFVGKAKVHDDLTIAILKRIR
jgi:sigma-B regulation protein RsbU (phosphoserine phosphatase)